VSASEYFRTVVVENGGVQVFATVLVLNMLAGKFGSWRVSQHEKWIIRLLNRGK
jgi:hypothetical protein